MVVINGTMYVFGGMTKKKTTNVLLSYNFGRVFTHKILKSQGTKVWKKNSGSGPKARYGYIKSTIDFDNVGILQV